MESDEPLHWGEVFFILHKHCNLDKWKIWEYTLPQVAELCASANKYIQFEVEMMTAPLRMFGGGGGEESSESTKIISSGDDEYHEITEEDLNMLARALGGG